MKSEIEIDHHTGDYVPYSFRTPHGLLVASETGPTVYRPYPRKRRSFYTFLLSKMIENTSVCCCVFQMLIKAGVDGKPTVFLFSDNQIKEESFVEDINMILNTGDVPNIFPADEKADVIEKMQTVARVEVS